MKKTYANFGTVLKEQMCVIRVQEGHTWLIYTNKEE
jgi:hypothetical protein